MNKTTNRRPISIPIPNSRERYFNHLEWKGINNHKNVMGVDQQTFIEADNVYIGTDNILTSRPPVTMREKWGLSGEIVNLWTFGEHIVVQTLEDDIYKIHFVYQDELIEIEDNIVNKDITVILLTRKIFVLSTNQFSAFDITGIENPWEFDARSYIYVPRNDEEDNLLIQGTRDTTFVWTNEAPPPWNTFRGREIRVLIDGISYTLVYELGIEKTWTSEFSQSFTSARIYKAKNAMTFAFQEDDTLYYSENGVTFSAITDTPAGFILVTISDNGDGIYGYHLNGDDRVVIDVYNIGGINALTWTGLAATEPSSLTLGYRIATMWADSQFFYLVGIIPEIPDIHFNSPTLLLRLPDINFGGNVSWLGVLGDPYNILNNGRIAWTDTTNNRPYISTAYLGNNTEDFVEIETGNYQYSSPRVIINNLWYDSTIPNYRFGGYSSVNIWPTNMTGLFKFVRPDIDSLKCIRRNGVNIVRGLLPVIQSPDIPRLFVFETTMANGGTSQLLSFRELPITSGQDLTKVLLGDDGDIITPKDYFVPNITGLNTRLSDIILRKFDNLFPNRVSIQLDNIIWQYDTEMQRLYVTNAKDNIEVSVSNIVEPTYIYFKHWLEWDDVILARGRDTYIAQYRTDTDGVFEWYIPAQSGVQNFNFDITGLHLLSNSEMAIFMEHEIWISTIQPADVNLYYYVKSKLPIGVRQGSDIMTTFDGRYILFSCERGLVALQYQQFMATTEQALTFISDNIQGTYDEFNTGPIKLYQYKYWVVIYRVDREQFYLLDMRNQSWWTWTLKQPTELLVTYNEKPLSLSDGNLFVLNGYDNYTDDGDEIKWVITSQLLHFDAINNFKQILSFILNSVDTDDKFVFSLQNINYRRESNTRRREVFEYDIDTVRTFIKRMQFSKVSEFQYQMRNADKSFSPVPLRLTDISIKYIVTERVR